MNDPLPDRARKGRGAVSNRTGRFERETRFAVDDGWSPAEQPEPPVRTSLGIDKSRSVITYNNSPDIPFDRSINPYRGCEHGCVYCFARPTHAYLGLSPGLDFETRLFYKPDAPEQLAAELRHRRYKPAVIALGTNTDPYQPVERDCGVTRRLLHVLSDHRHPVAIVTKSNLILRDIDILAEMAAHKLAAVTISVTTLDRDLARRLEPRAPTPARRLEAIRSLRAAGVPVSVLTAPMIPALNDWEMDRILAAAAEAGAVGAGYVYLRLPHEIKDLFAEWLATHAPDKRSHVLNLIREGRGGKLYSAEWGARMRGKGPYAVATISTRRGSVFRPGPATSYGYFKPLPATGLQ
jgi:DNA repair photolyase